jgi:predicted AlkP superfamily pyrophosphatase or phosphodiesterase
MRWLCLLALLWGQTRPKLIIGIVVDQMRADYLHRMVAKRSRGFGLLLQEGLVYWNCHYTYFPTYTGPGHASIYTGTPPAYHGIVANDWWERRLSQVWYCVTDTTVRPVGTDSPVGQRSPRVLWASTVTDELRYASGFQSKVIGIALKDRSAILPAGRSGTLALWFDSKKGVWVTSSYYTDTLPGWVQAFNARHYPDSLLRVPWQLSGRYACVDDSPYEGTMGQPPTRTFPHQPASYEELLWTTAGPWLTFALAKAAIESEKLGKGPYPDFLAISLSTPDLAGHRFGTESCELQALYAELDRQLGDFLAYLLRRFRKEELWLFLTADHGAAPTPEVLAEQKRSAGRYPEKALVAEAQAFLRQLLGWPDTAQPIAAFLNQSFYLSERLSRAEKSRAAHALKGWLLERPLILAAYTAEELTGPGGSAYPFQMIQAGFAAQRSGDVVAVYAPGWIEGSYTHGTTHGSIWSYDTHVPLIWWGGGLRPKAVYRRVPITAIAPTIALGLGIPLPNACFTPPLEEVIEGWRTPSFEWWEGPSGP